VLKLVALGLLVAVVIVAAAAAQGASSGAHESKKLRPHRGKSVLLTPKRGTVILYRRGNRKVTGPPEPLRVGHTVRVPLGSVVDTSSGAVTVTSAISPFGTETAKGSFSEGVFAVHQTGSDTALTLGGNGARVCSAPRRLKSRAPGRFMVIAGRSGSRPVFFGKPSATPVPWVAVDRCTETKIKGEARRIQVIDLGSRRATPRRAHRLFTSERGRFTTTGRHSSATVRGRVVAR
jgi:hypothetical protein